jgi:pilus assembly protein CpaF
MEDLQELVAHVRQTLSERVDLSRKLSDDDIKRAISEIIAERSHSEYLSLKDKTEIMNSVYQSMRGLDVIQPLIDDPGVTEIMVNDFDKIFYEKEGKLYKSDIHFRDRKRLEDVIQNIVEPINRQVNESSPIVDARLGNGSRVNIVLPPIALSGPTVTIRKFPESPMTMEQLIRLGSLTEAVAEFLKDMVLAKYNIFISGGTGSGKTTFLNALSNYIPSDERIITIEDSAELQIQGIPNLVRLESRNANMEGKGAITIRDLIKSSLRMRPERIVVGEVRGAEALDMLQAMNTGHDGSLSTGHANSAKDMLSRLETMVLTGADFPIEAIRQQIASAVDIIIHLGRLRDHSRRVLEITEVLRYENGTIIRNPLYIFKEEGEDEDGKIIGVLQRTDNEMQQTEKFRSAGLKCRI